MMADDPVEFSEDTHRRMAARMILISESDPRSELEREIDHSMNGVGATVDSLIWVAMGALREWARLRGTTIEACLMDLLDPGPE
jgi:hypothetical protein